MRKIFTLLILAFAFYEASGQVAIGSEGGILPLGSYPAYYNQYLKGGFKSGPDIASRDAYPMNLRDTHSFMFYTTGDASFWVLQGGLTNEFWVKLNISGGTASINSGTAFPAAPAEGEGFFLTTDKRLYVYNGTAWIPSDNALAAGQLYVGDANGIAVATAKSTIPISGFDKAAADIALGDGTTNFKITNLADPIAAQDAATKNYVDTKAGGTKSGTTFPLSPAAGEGFYHTTDNRLYVYNGTAWIPSDNALAAGQLYVGDANGIAVATAKSAIPISGFDKAVADIALGDGTTNFKITNLADPASAQDAATKNYVDTKAGGTKSGTTFPLSPAAGEGFYNTTDNRPYVYNGTAWIPSDNALAAGQLYVGDTNGIAVATAKSAIPISGFDKAAADIALGDGTTNFKITNLADPAAAQDAATKNYVDSKAGGTNSGAAFPLSPVAGEGFYHTTDNRLYVYNGTAWIPSDNALATGQLYVGDTNGIAVATAKSAIPISGFDKAVADIALGDGTTNFKITNLADPASAQDAATKNYVDTRAGGAKSGTTFPLSPAAGEGFYNTTDNRPYVYNGTAWIPSDNSLATGQLYVGDANGIATAIAKSAIPVSDLGAAATPISMGRNQINDVADPAAAQDAATKKYVDSSLGSAKDNLGTHMAAQNLKMSAFSISNDGDAGDGLTFDADGNAFFGQDVTVNYNVLTPSDQRLKTKVETLSDVLQSIDRMRGVRFEYINQNKYAKGSKIGVIAQELQKVYPELVMKGADGFLKVDYTQLTGILIQAVKEQQILLKKMEVEIIELNRKTDSQQDQINRILEKMK